MSLWLAERNLVLASKSESRRTVLQNAGIPVDVVPAEIDERAIETQSGSGDARKIALLLARAKAQAVAAQMPGPLVLGADQTLALGERLFTKPTDRASAREQLLTLRGKTHTLHAAVAVARDGEIVFEYCDEARLTMRAFSDGFLDRYLDAAGHGVTASVGAYQVEGPGIHLFERIEGSHFTILGLPLVPLLEFLRREGELSA
jgi:septum formation protein